MAHLIVVKEPGKAPEKRTIPSLDLQPMQEIVGGFIEYIPLSYVTTGISPDSLDLFLNEEGKLEGLEPNVWLRGRNDFIAGTLFICTSDDEGASIGLTEEQADKAVAGLSSPDVDMTEVERQQVAARVARMFR